MSLVAIRTALELGLNGISPALATAWENRLLKPTPAPSTPYQMVHVLWAEPDNAEIGSSHQEIGFMQVTLLYPLNAGTSAASTRAELIRTTFPRGASFVSGGFTVNIMKTPEVMPSNVEEDRLVTRVKIPFRVFIPN